MIDLAVLNLTKSVPDIVERKARYPNSALVDFTDLIDGRPKAAIEA